VAVSRNKEDIYKEVRLEMDEIITSRNGTLSNGNDKKGDTKRKKKIYKKTHTYTFCTQCFYHRSFNRFLRDKAPPEETRLIRFCMVATFLSVMFKKRTMQQDVPHDVLFSEIIL